MVTWLGLKVQIHAFDSCRVLQKNLNCDYTAFRFVHFHGWVEEALYITQVNRSSEKKCHAKTETKLSQKE